MYFRFYAHGGIVKLVLAPQSSNLATKFCNSLLHPSKISDWQCKQNQKCENFFAS